MISWLFFALLAPAVVSIVIFIDKYLLEKEVKDYRGMPIYGAIMSFIFGTLFWIAYGFPTLTLKDTLLVMLTGMLSTFGSAAYFKVIASEEASKVIILLQTIPLFVLILSALFLKEIITLPQLLGFSLILIGAVGVTAKKNDFTLHLSSAFLFMLLANFFWASSNVLFKFVIDANSFIKVVSYESWGIAVGGVLLYGLFPSIRNSFGQTNKSISKKALAILFLNEGFYVLSRLLTFLALSMGSVALVSVLGSTTVFFGIIYGWFLMMIAPKIFKENITKKEVIKKILLASIVFCGIVLIS